MQGLQLLVLGLGNLQAFLTPSRKGGEYKQLIGLGNAEYAGALFAAKP